jgi:hypothetical protein
MPTPKRSRTTKTKKRTRTSKKRGLPSGRCHACGCTESNACRGGCAWVDKQRTLCTECCL